ncbi:hypothetical protein C9E85_04770 [Plesiomonas shigelloides]|nr:hypothetical protein C9E85_04770 [Plesiomonas shigelloides]
MTVTAKAKITAMTKLMVQFAFQSIPFLLEVAAVLAAFVHPNHIVCLCSWGFTHLPPTCNFKLFGYIENA